MTSVQMIALFPLLTGCIFTSRIKKNECLEKDPPGYVSVYKAGKDSPARIDDIHFIRDTISESGGEDVTICDLRDIVAGRDNPKFAKIPASGMEQGDLIVHDQKDQVGYHIGLICCKDEGLKEISAVPGDSARPFDDPNFQSAIQRHDFSKFPGDYRFYRLQGVKIKPTKS